MRKNILLAEQAAVTISLIKETLSGDVFDITTVSDGEIAKELLEEKSFDLVITEAMLPRFHGFNLSLHVKSKYPSINVILTSSVYKGMEARFQAIQQYRADEFFEKPFDPAAFRRRALELLNLTEHDLTAPAKPSAGGHTDTNKIPTLKALEEEANKLTSEDLFGDIIASVQEPSPPKRPNPSAMTQQVPAMTQQIPMKTQQTSALTQQMPALTQQTPKTTQTVSPPATRLSQGATGQTPAAPAPRSQTPAQPQLTQRLNINELDRLLRPAAPTPMPPKDPRKKIEDEISQRLEDTISGLGLKQKAPKKPMETAPPAPPQAPARPATPPAPPSPATIVMSPVTPVSQTVLIPQSPFLTQATAPEEKRDEVGGYEIIGLIARGGMAEIYKAKRKGVKGFEKVLALKKILSGYGKDDKYIEMFVDEAKIAAELSHPNIVQIYDLGKQDDYYFIAMEYVAGKDLRLILRKLADMGQLFPEYLSLFMIMGILDALNYAHNATDSGGRTLDIVHRDVSPPNILVSYTGDVKLTDFGVSKASIKMHHTVAGALKGKLLYMSPEQAKADKDIDYRSDLYSAGIILFELLTGKKLFLETSEMAVLQKVQAGEIMRPSEVKKDIHPQLEAIVMKMLQKDKMQRYLKGSDIIQDLHEYMTQHYSAAPTPIHLSHAICALFKEDIRRENQRVDIKALPYRVERIKQAPDPVEQPPVSSRSAAMASVTPPAVPVSPSPPPATAPKPRPTAATPPPVMTPAKTAPVQTIREAPPPEMQPTMPLRTSQRELPDLPEFPEIPPVTPSDAPTDPHRPSPTTSILKPAPKFEPLPETPYRQPLLVEEEEKFQPLIEINFDEPASPAASAPETTPVIPAAPPPHSAPYYETHPGIPHRPAAADHIRTGFMHHEESAWKKKKNILMIALAVVLLLASVIVFLLVSGSRETPPPEAGAGTAPGQTIQPSGAGIFPPDYDAYLRFGLGYPRPMTSLPAFPPQEEAEASAMPASAGEPATPPTTPPEEVKTAETTDKKAEEDGKAVNTEAEKNSAAKEDIKPADKAGEKDKKDGAVDKPATTPDTAKMETPAQKKPEGESRQEPPVETAKTAAAEPQPAKTNESPSPAEAVTVQEGQVMPEQDVDSPPVPIKNPSIQLTDRDTRTLEQNQEQVMVRYLVDHNGNVETLRLLRPSSSKRINGIVEKTISEWKFKPALKNNLRVRVWKTLSLTIKK